MTYHRRTLNYQVLIIANNLDKMMLKYSEYKSITVFVCYNVYDLFNSSLIVQKHFAVTINLE